jgi:hypothetical protein
MLKNIQKKLHELSKIFSGQDSFSTALPCLLRSPLTLPGVAVAKRANFAL